MPAPPPVAAKVIPWLRANLGKGALGALTTTDVDALQAAVQILFISPYDNRTDLIEAFATVVRRMQPSCYEFAYHAIAMVMDWPDRAIIWQKAKLPDFPVGLCKNEPASRHKKLPIHVDEYRESTA